MRVWRVAGRRGGLQLRHVLAFAAGWSALGVALLSALDSWAEVLFSAHMVQHELIMLIAAPMLVISKPLAAVAWALRAHGGSAWLRHLGGVLRSAWWLTLATPFVAWTVHALAVWLWHAPPLFQAALTNDWVHAVQHGTFLFSALLFWGSLLRFWRDGLAVVYVLTTAIHTGVLGALITFAPAPLYSGYFATAAAAGLTPLEDQHLGGLIMWVPGGMVMLMIGLTLFGHWLGAAEQRTLAFRESRDA
jgi:cytochrome c oxidase assembly factor CtaG